MRLNLFNDGAKSFAGTGGTVTGPLILFADPVNPLEAATKQYTDSTIGSHTSNGVLHLVGNEKTLLTSLTVTSTDINKIAGTASNVQAQLDGKISLTGGSFTGFVNLHSNPSASLHLATKQYADSGVTNSSDLKVGDIVRKPVSVTPTGFLRTNGAELSKTTYSALFAVIGDKFDLLQIGSGKPWKQQYDINLTQSTDITGWTTGASLPGTVQLSQAIVTKNRVYLLGGYINGGESAVVYTAPINADGTLGTWTTGTSLPVTVRNSQAIVTKNRVYILGGIINSADSAVVYTAPINTDGTIDAWTTGASLPGTVRNSQVIVTKNRVYLLGAAINGTASTAIVYTAPINTDGTLGAWTTGTSLPGIVQSSSVIVTKNRVYLLGGMINGTNSAVVYTAPINTDGTLGTWTGGSSLPGAIGLSQAIVTKNRVYILGGFINGAFSAVVYTAPINADGTLGTWTTGTSLPGTVISAQAIVTKNRVYVLGGHRDGVDISEVISAPILEGLNDYSPYYDGTINATDPLNFALPDYGTVDDSTPDIKYYIKS